MLIQIAEKVVYTAHVVIPFDFHGRELNKLFCHLCDDLPFK